MAWRLLILHGMKQSNELIKEIISLTRQMIILADEGHANANDDGCRLLFSVVQDCAYKIRSNAEQEREKHRLSGRWDEEHCSEEKLSQDHLISE